MSRYIIGIDPGVTGGWSAWYKKKLIAYNSFEPVQAPVLDFNTISFQSLQDFFINLDKYRDGIIFVIEKQWGRPISGSKQSFITGYNYNELLHFLSTVYGINTVKIITPNEWMKHFWGKEKNTKKKLSLKYACKVSGVEIKDHNIADAILIGKYGVDTYGK